MRSEPTNNPETKRDHSQPSRHVDGLLPAFLNGTLDHFGAERVRVHLAICPACEAQRRGWEMIRRASQASVATAPAPRSDLLNQVWSTIERDDASRRLVLVQGSSAPAASFFERMRSMLPLTREPSRRSLVRPLTVAAAGAAIVAAVALTPIGSYAQGFLTIFTPQTFQAVPITPAEIASLPDLSNYGTYTHSPHARPQSATNAATASSLAGFAVLAPSSLPSSVTGSASYEVVPGQSGSFTFNAARARATAAKQGKSLPPMPTNVDGATIQVTTGAGVLTSYGGSGSGLARANPTTAANIKIKEAQNPGSAQAAAALDGPQLVIGQTPAPTVSSTGASVGDVENYLLAQPGISPDLANAIRAIGDPSTTLPIPIPVGKATSHPIQVEGVTGLSVADSTGLGGVIIWQKNGMVFGVAGQLTESQLLAVANSLQ